MEDCAEEIPIAIPPPLKSHLEDDCFWIVRKNRLVRLPRRPSVEALLGDYYSHCSAGATEETNLSLLAEVLDGVKIYFDFMLADHLLYSQERTQYKNHILGGARLDNQQPAQQLNAPEKEGTAVNSLVDGRDENGGDSHEGDKGEKDNKAAGNDTESAKMEVDGQSPVAVNHAAPPIGYRPPDPSSVYGAEHLLRLFVRLPLFLSRVQLPSTHLQTLQQYLRDLLGYICSRRQVLFSEDHYEELPTSLENPD